MTPNLYQYGFYTSTTIAVIEAYVIYHLQNKVNKLQKQIELLESGVMKLSKRIDKLEKKSS